MKKFRDNFCKRFQNFQKNMRKILNYYFHDMFGILKELRKFVGKFGKNVSEILEKNQE